MATIVSSFVSDIIQSFFDDFQVKLGEGSDVYPMPPYMQLKTIGLAGGVPQLDAPDQKCPALWMEYLAGGDTEGALGRTHFGMREDFNLFAKMVMSPATLDMADRNVEDFRTAANASTDMLMRRIWKACVDWTGAITCPLIGGSTNGAQVSTWAYVLTARDTLLVEGRVMLHLFVKVE